jgi:membrane-associated phospholipid phosphatase
MSTFSKFISILIHPIFIPLYAFFCYVNIGHFSILNLQNLTSNQLYVFSGLIVFFTILFPITSILIMRKSNIISDYELSVRKERMPVLISSLIYLGVYYYLIRSLELNKFEVEIFGSFLSVIWGGIIVSLLCILITYFWKISLHTAAISGLAGGLMALSLLLTPISNFQEIVLLNSVAILLVGIVGFSRLFLKAHNYLQVIAGMILGFSVEFLVVKNDWAL